jgi:hypothetical protein
VVVNEVIGVMWHVGEVGDVMQVVVVPAVEGNDEPARLNRYLMLTNYFPICQS